MSVMEQHQHDLTESLQGLSMERRRVLNELTTIDKAIKSAVALGIRHHLTWPQIGRALNMNSGSAWRKYGKR